MFFEIPLSLGEEGEDSGDRKINRDAYRKFQEDFEGIMDEIESNVQARLKLNDAS
jgi:hypothetical protein